MNTINEVSNRVLDGLANYYKTHITCADGSQENDDYIMGFARLLRENGYANRRQRMAELARTGLSNKEIDFAGLWFTPLERGNTL